MDADAPRDLLGCFDALEDPRVERIEWSKPSSGSRV